MKNPFISATPDSANKTTTYNNGATTFTKEGGSLAWRNNNPGNLKYKTEKGALDGGAIGAYSTDGGFFGIFATPEEGWDAMNNWWDKQPDDRSVMDAMRKYAPPSENDTDAYLDHINRKVNIDKTIGDLTDSERDDLNKMIGKHEGWNVGKERDGYPDEFDIKTEEQARELMATPAYQDSTNLRYEDAQNAVSDYYKNTYDNGENVERDSVYMWFTEEDERVCKICGPLHGKIVDDDTRPPAHPSCRCRVERMKVAKDGILVSDGRVA